MKSIVKGYTYLSSEFVNEMNVEMVWEMPYEVYST